MKYSQLFALSIAAALISLPTIAGAGPITLSYSTSSETLMENFSSLPSGTYDGIFDGNNVKVGESFVGQTVGTTVGSDGYTYETVSGVPTDPLTLATPDLGDGIAGSTGVTGLYGDGINGFDLGEGLVSILFDYNITEFGLAIRGSNGGEATFNFFGRDGSLIDSITFTTLVGSLPEYTFSSTVAFAGITISNTDTYGLSYDEFRFAEQAEPVPEPSTLPLLALGLLLTQARRIKAQLAKRV